MKTADTLIFVDRLGGPGFLNPRHYLIAAGILMLAGVSTSSEVGDVATLGFYAYANFLSIVIAAFAFLTIRFAHSVKYFEFRFWHVLLTGLILGATKAFATALIVVALNLETLDTAIQSRLISGTLIGGVLVLLLSSIPLVVEEYGKNRAVLIREAVARKLADSIEPISKSITAELEALSNSNLPSLQVAEKLENLVSKKLRPLSKDLWDSTAKKYPDFRLRSLALQGLKTTPIPIWPMIAIYAIGSPGLKQFLAGEIDGLTVVLIQSIGIFASVFLANLIRKARKSVTSNLFAILGISLSMNLLPDVFGLNIPGYNQVLGLVLVSINASFNLVLISIIAAGIKAKQNQDAEIAEVDRKQLDFEAEEISRLLASRRTAEILHGQVQNRILGFAVRISTSDNVQDELAALVTQLQGLHHLTAEADPELVMEMLKSDWNGVLRIESAIQGLSRPIGFEVSEAIREAVTNAHKHGLASEVKIRIEFQANSLAIEVLDDGIGPRKGRPGLGQKLLESLGPWKLSGHPEGGARLSFVLKD